jgi:hypothetical protein
VVRKAPPLGELNDKIRELLAGHIDRGIKQAVDRALRAVDERLDARFMEKLADQVYDVASRRLDGMTPELVEHVTGAALTALGPQLEAGSPAPADPALKEEAAEHALAFVRANASKLGEAAFPRLRELVEEHLASRADPMAETRVDAPAPSGMAADLPPDLSERLHRLEEELEAASGLAPLLGELDARLRSLEGGLPGEAMLADLEARLEAVEASGAASAAAAPSAELSDRVAELEASRAEFGEQVAEQVADLGDALHAARQETSALSERLGALDARLGSLAERLEALANREPPAPARKPSEVPATIDLKELSERVAVLAVGPLMEAIDGRLGELNLSEVAGLGERLARLEEAGPAEAEIDVHALAQRVAVHALAPVMEAVDGRLAELGGAATPEAPHTEGYVEDDSAAGPAPPSEAQEEAGGVDPTPADSAEASAAVDALGDAPPEEGDPGTARRKRSPNLSTESDSFYLDDDFARFRRERLKETGRLQADPAGEQGAAAGPSAEASEPAPPEGALREHAGAADDDALGDGALDDDHARDDHAEAAPLEQAEAEGVGWLGDAAEVEEAEAEETGPAEAEGVGWLDDVAEAEPQAEAAPADDMPGYVTESDAGRLDPYAPPAQDPAARRQELEEHANQWKRHHESGREQGAEDEGDPESTSPPPSLPNRPKGP